MSASSRRVDAAAAKRVYAEADRLVDVRGMEDALDRMAGAITARVGESDPIVLCVLNGAIVPVGKLLPRLNFPLKVDSLQATRYEETTRGGKLEWRVEPRTPLHDRVVLIIDDILDAGITLASILDYCRLQGAREIYSGVLVRKRRRREVDVPVDFVGLEIDDRYVFGYGMDYHGYWRNAPGLFAVKDQ